MKKWMLMIVVVVLLFPSAAIPVFGHHQPTPEEINEIIEEVALEKHIPPVILKAVAWKESRKNQFMNGEPFVHAGNQGIMQINRVHNSRLDKDALLHDARYNIEVGADVLLGRWFLEDIATVGDRDPDVLENWYFALWGYNGWLGRNNPVDHNGDTYQDGIFELIRSRYKTPVSSLDWSRIPAGETTPRGFNLSNPDTVSRGHLRFLQPGDQVEAAPEDLWLLEAPGEPHSGWAPEGSVLRVDSNPRLEDGVYWYRLESLQNGSQGWARGLDLIPIKVGEEEKADVFKTMHKAKEEVLLLDPLQEPLEPTHGEEHLEESDTLEEIVFQDMIDHPAQEAVERLNAAGFVSGTSPNQYDPDRPVTRQELVLVFGKALDLEEGSVEYIVEEKPQDWEEVSSWAQDSMAIALEHRIITGHSDGGIRPKDHATREEGLVMLVKALDLEMEEEIEPLYRDAHEISQWAVPAVNALVEKEVLEPSAEMDLSPNRNLTRGEMAILLDRVQQQGLIELEID